MSRCGYSDKITPRYRSATGVPQRIACSATVLAVASRHSIEWSGLAVREGWRLIPVIGRDQLWRTKTSGGLAQYVHAVVARLALPNG